MDDYVAIIKAAAEAVKAEAEQEAKTGPPDEHAYTCPDAGVSFNVGQADAVK